MSGRTILVMGLALVCGLAAAVGIQVMRRQPAAVVVETQGVVFAVAEIQRGETIKEAMMEVRQLPLDQVPPGALSKLSDALDRTAHIPMLKGDAVVDAKLAPKGAGGGMAALIRPGMRAFTIQTPSFSSSLAGLLLPGNRVDVLLTINGTGGPSADDETRGATTTLLQKVEILAVHTTVDTPANHKIDPNEARSVTLLVTPQDAALLDFGQNKGTLHLSLRNLKDDGVEKTKPATMADLELPHDSKAKPVEVVQAAPVAPPPPPPAPAPAPPAEVTLAVRTLRGTYAGIDRITIRAHGVVVGPVGETIAQAARVTGAFP